ncbi:cyclodeaminase/cyclohydrolase family protein [Alkalibacterium sp. f15]|uniref:cyclodeaminase/cyclohydrolase family protein n=1 Tax=Alkalibacterium sp. f15 TaxID=3414029 RepID=UPI003BF84FBA
MNEVIFSAYLTELGSKDGSSGGGSSAAYIGAMSASLARMVADIQKDKKKYADQKDKLVYLLKESQRIRESFEDLAKADALAFKPVLDAYKLPKETLEEQGLRDAAIEQALKTAVEPPRTMLDEGLSLIRVLEELTSMRMKGTIVNDLMVATLFMESVLETAVLNVTINTKLMKDNNLKNQLEKEAKKNLVQGKQRLKKLSDSISFFLEHNKWPEYQTEEE